MHDCGRGGRTERGIVQDARRAAAHERRARIRVPAVRKRERAVAGLDQAAIAADRAGRHIADHTRWNIDRQRPRIDGRTAGVRRRADQANIAGARLLKAHRARAVVLQCGVDDKRRPAGHVGVRQHQLVAGGGGCGQHAVAGCGAERQAGRAIRNLHARHRQRGTAEGDDRLRRRLLREQRYGRRVGPQRDAAGRAGRRDTRGFA